jgi:hypothetical protein
MITQALSDLRALCEADETGAIGNILVRAVAAMVREANNPCDANHQEMRKQTAALGTVVTWVATGESIFLLANMVASSVAWEEENAAR